MTALDQQIETFFKERNCSQPDIGLLQPADPILNAAGEDIRRRIFITADQHGKTMCLRPEFTIPVCLAHIESGKSKKRYAYSGKVFRQRNEECDEFYQAGIEDIGAKNAVSADVKSLSEAVELLRLLGKNRLTITIGDQAIFEAMLKSLGLPLAWRKRLGRVFGDPARLSADLDRLSGATSNDMLELGTALEKSLAAKDREGVEKAINKKMREAGLSPQSGRTPKEIAKRLMQKTELASVTLSSDKRRILEEFLKLDLSIGDTNTKLWTFARKYNVSLGNALEDFHKRCIALKKLDLKNVSIRYRSNFGRRLDYYTGFVFEIHGSKGSGKKPLAGGGRYDKLLDLLGSKQNIPAVGFAVYVDRVKAKTGPTIAGKQSL